MSTCNCTVHVTIFSTGGKFQPVSTFTELHALTQATRFYALLQAYSTDIWVGRGGVLILCIIPYSGMEVQ